MLISTDIDIDFVDRDSALRGLIHIPALQKDGNKHKTSVYFQDIPFNPIDETTSLNPSVANALGYFKIDFLNNGIYKNIKDEDHLMQLAYTEPPWEVFGEECIVEKLSQIHNRFDIVSAINPKSIEDLAIIIALIRPAKKGLYKKTRAEIDTEIWSPNSDGYYFKKSHAIAYALGIVVQLNLMIEQL